MKLRIEGYTDSIGSANKNTELSTKRANTVRIYLIQHFNIESHRLEAKGYGEANPIASNNTADGRAQNRRIEFVIMD